MKYNTIKSSPIGQKYYSHNLHRIDNMTLGSTLKVEKMFITENIYFCAVNTEFTKPTASKVQHIHSFFENQSYRLHCS